MPDPDELKLLLETLSAEEAHTLIRQPGATVTPPRDLSLGRRALEVLKTLSHDPRALVEEGPLGQGGMGVVTLARQVALNRHVAVKSLKPELRSEREAEALLAEAWLTGGLEHPNITPVYSLSLDPAGLPVLVMKRIEGVTWGQLLRDPALLARHAPEKAPLDEHLRILEQVCNAVHFAHARGVVHRDLKPDNVMVGGFGEVYVVDWGIAAPFGPSSQLAGTPAYMAPEMLGTPGAALTARTDVYLLGAVLFEVLAGRAPHAAASPRELFEVVQRSAPTLPAGAPAELADLVLRAMSADPAQRPASALEFRRALEAFQQHQGSTALAAQSSQVAQALLAALSQPGAERAHLDALFSECRFGFRQALVSWPGNAAARAALDEVLEAMIRYELRAGSARAAQSLLSELSTPARLQDEVAAGVAREADKDARLERLARLELSLDPATGSHRRAVVASAVGVVWIASPLLGEFVLRLQPHDEVLFSLIAVVLTALLLGTVWWRTRVQPELWTPLNRQLIRAVLYANVAQLFLAAVLVGAGLAPGRVGTPLLALYWAFVSGLIAASMLPAIWLTALGYLTAGLVGLWRPELRNLMASFASLVLCVNAFMLVRGGALERR